jgi:hypothetical protein
VRPVPNPRAPWPAVSLAVLLGCHPPEFVHPPGELVNRDLAGCTWTEHEEGIGLRAAGRYQWSYDREGRLVASELLFDSADAAEPTTLEVELAWSGDCLTQRDSTATTGSSISAALETFTCDDRDAPVALHRVETVHEGAELRFEAHHDDAWEHDYQRGDRVLSRYDWGADGVFEEEDALTWEGGQLVRLERDAFDGAPDATGTWAWDGRRLVRETWTDDTGWGWSLDHRYDDRGRLAGATGAFHGQDATVSTWTFRGKEPFPTQETETGPAGDYTSTILVACD